MRPVPPSVVLVEDTLASQLEVVLPNEVIRTQSVSELCSSVRRLHGVAFVDVALLPQLTPLEVPVIGIIDCKPASALPTIVQLLEKYAWLSHVVTTSMLAAPGARHHLAMLIGRFALGPEQGLLAGNAIGRVALLASASRRAARFERMQEFFAKHGLSERAISTIVEVAEELVMNALYDAPAEAGYFKTPRERIEDVDLPHDLACEISYGIEDGTAFVRLRDPFGALCRSRLVQVLSRCSPNQGVGLDVSRGGAGLGLWRVFSVASMVAVTVVPGTLTEVLVGVRIKDRRTVVKQLQAIHLFFAAKSDYYESLAIVPDDEHDGLVDQSITLILVA